MSPSRSGSRILWGFVEHRQDRLFRYRGSWSRRPNDSWRQPWRTARDRRTAALISLAVIAPCHSQRRRCKDGFYGLLRAVVDSDKGPMERALELGLRLASGLHWNRRRAGNV
jgi:hypothetical protein